MYSKSGHLERKWCLGKSVFCFFHVETKDLLEGIVAATGNARKEVFLRASETALLCVYMSEK